MVVVRATGTMRSTGMTATVNDNGDCDANLHCPLGWTESPGRHTPEGVHEHVSRGDKGIHALDVGITVSWAMCHTG